MTATLAPPPPPTAAADPGAGGVASRRPHPGAPRPARRPIGPLLAELMLVAVTLVAVAGFARLFRDRSAVAPLVVAAAGAHAVAALARRRGWGAAATVAVTAAALAVEASLVLYPHTSAYGIPSPATLDAMLHDLREAWDLFGQVRAPAPRSRGFLLASTATLWVAVALADWAAFRLRTIAEAVLPAGALFVFTTLLGRGRGGVALTALLVASVLGFAAAQRALRSGRDDAWVGGRARAGTAALVRRGGAVAAAVAVVAVVVGPRLPTAGDEALVDWRGEQGPDGRTTVSPLVDIRSRLVEQTNVTVFTVRSDRPAYWRLTSLDVFNGRVWSSSERFEEADGELPGELPEATTDELVQEFTINRLKSIWAPAAAQPVDLVDSSTSLRWNGELATIIVNRDEPDIDGATYTVVSQVPAFSPDDLDARQPDVDDLPDEVAEALELPEGLSPVVAEMAAQAVAGAGDRPYDRALALQDWFREGFTYDLSVGAGHGGDAVVEFLDRRTGYCEQFAGTYAAMARTLGLPARVAVGYTPGDPRADGTGYTVRGRNAHAWPEVWISGAGWVPFEPTPGRGAPGAEDYTGVPFQQDEHEQVPTTTAPATTAPPTTQAGGTSVPPTTLPPDVRGPSGDPGGATPDEGGAGWPMAVLLALLAVVALVGLDAGAIALVRARRARTAEGDESTAGRVRAAWARAVGALRLVGVVPAPAETAREFARRARGDLGEAGGALVRLAAMVTATTWAPATLRPDPALVHQADELATRISSHAHDTAGWKPRLRTALDPRTLRAR